MQEGDRESRVPALWRACQLASLPTHMLLLTRGLCSESHNLGPVRFMFEALHRRCSGFTMGQRHGGDRFGSHIAHKQS